MSKLYLGSSLIQITSMGTTAGNLEMWSPPPMGTMSIETQHGYATYSFVIGMTWKEWIESEYNTGGYYIYKEEYITPDGSAVISPENNSFWLIPNDIIQNGATYVIHDRLVIG